MENDMVAALAKIDQVLMPLRIIEMLLALFLYDALTSVISFVRCQLFVKTAEVNKHGH